MDFRLLGPVEVHRNDQPLDLGVYKQRALLAVLLINANRVVSTDHLIEDIWAADDGRDRQNALWVNISRLRSVLEPEREKRAEATVLVTRPPGYLLSIDASAIDAVRFEQLSSAGRALTETDPTEASRLLSEALALWRGRALEEFTYEAFAEAEIARLEELRLAAVEDRVTADLAAGRSRELIGELEGLVRTHPLRERLTAHLMLALYRSGRQGDALRAFGALQSRMGEELGLEPSSELVQLEERIVLDDPELASPQRPPATERHRPSGLSVRGYEIRDRIGEGALGESYSAFQPAVGREVAIKIVRPELANDPDFIRRFEAGARAVSHLEHPQVVPLFDYWREPDAAFLVMRRFERGNLADLVAEGRLRTVDALGIIEQIGGALASAHRRGVHHGALKPTNVLIDNDDNAYLADFGMSYPMGRSRADAFRAPELDESAEATIRSDLFSLGAVARFALRESERPDAELAGQLAPVVDQATAIEPSLRFPDVTSFLDAIRAAVGSTQVGTVAEETDGANPYLGLRPFQEDDADHFFGRERLIERLLARLGHSGPRGRFIALVGPSGSGKSSVIRAGLVPALRDGAVVGSESWFVVTMTPGTSPFESLEEALHRIAVSPPANLLEQLTTLGIATAVRSLMPDPGSQVVIVVDQMEELFSLASPADADAFMTALAKCAGDRHSSVKVIATLRADFYDHPLRHETFGELLRLGTEAITPMNAEELERAITAPAGQVGVTFEPGLVASMVSDMAGQSTALPLLQYALTELYEQRIGGVVTASTYRKLGGVSAALGRRADAIYDGLTGEDQRGARDVFLQLVTLTDGSADTRRRALMAHLTDGGRRDVAHVLNAFGRHRLISFDRDPVTRGPTVEIAHEALLTAWAMLRSWIDEARSDIQAQRRLAAGASEWHSRDKNPDFLLAGARLARYDGWIDAPPVHVTAHERQFLEASHQLTEAELDDERRRVRRLRGLVAGIGLALAVALGAGGVAWVQRSAAIDAATEAELATLVSRSAAVVDDDSDLALLLALEANMRAPGADTDQAVLTALGGATLGNRIASRQMMPDDCLGGRSFFPSQFHGMVELANIDGRLLSRDPLTGEITDTGSSPAPCVIGGIFEAGSVAVTLDGARLWTGPNLEVEVDLGRPMFPELVTPTRVLIQVDHPTEEATVLTLVDSRTGEVVEETTTDGFTTRSVRNDDATLIAVGTFRNLEEAGTLYVIDADSGAVLLELDFPINPDALAFTDDDELIVGFRGGRVLILDPRTGELTADVDTGRVTAYLDAGVRPDGTLVLAGRDTIDIVDPTSGVVERSIELQNAGLAFVRPDGLVVAVDDQGQIDVFDPDASALIERSWEVDSFGHVAMVDGRAALLSRSGDFVEIIDLETGDRAPIELTLPDEEPFETRIVWPEPDGAWAVSADLVLARWQDGEMVESIEIGSEDGVRWIPYGRKPVGTRFGDLYAVIGLRPDGTREATLVRMERENAAVLFSIETEAAWVHPSADGGLYTIDQDGTLRTFDAEAVLIDQIDVGAADPSARELAPYAVTLDRSGSRLAVPAFAGGVFVVDLATGEVDIVPGRGIASTLGFSPDGSLLVMAMFDGAVRLYDVEAGGVPAIVWDGSGAFDSEPGWYDDATDSMWMMSGGKLLQIPVSAERWIARACDVVGRELTQEEWDLYVPGDQPLRSTCA